jgi:(2Fe-2S) ferredoxin
MRFEKHIFICANQKAEGKACCGEAAGLKLVEKMRALLKEKGLNTRIRAQRSGCLDACSMGPAMVIYPEGTYYGHVTEQDIERIVQQHLIEGKLVEELELKWPAKVGE